MKQCTTSGCYRQCFSVILDLCPHEVRLVAEVLQAATELLVIAVPDIRQLTLYSDRHYFQHRELFH